MPDGGTPREVPRNCVCRILNRLVALSFHSNGFRTKSFPNGIAISFHLCETLPDAICARRHLCYISRPRTPRLSLAASGLPPPAFLQAWSPQAVHTHGVSVPDFLRCCMCRDSSRRLPDAVLRPSPTQQTLPTNAFTARIHRSALSRPPPVFAGHAQDQDRSHHPD